MLWLVRNRISALRARWHCTPASGTACGMHTGASLPWHDIQIDYTSAAGGPDCEAHLSSVQKLHEAFHALASSFATKEASLVPSASVVSS